MTKLDRLLGELENAIDNNAATYAATMDETLRASRGLELLREAIARGIVDPTIVHLAVNVTMDSLLPMLRDMISIRNGVRESDVRRAQIGLGPKPKQEDVAAALDTSARTVRRLLAYGRQLDGIPTKKRRATTRAKRK